jgi:hypothetical protein
VRAERVVRDGVDWLLGTPSDVAWIDDATNIGLTITSAIPPVFDAYATVVLPEGGHSDEQQRHERAVIELLRRASADQLWWLGYLDTGAHDVVFPEAPRVSLYADWDYVIVQAGPEQAARWREPDASDGSLPDLIFPVDRSWLLSTLWDDDWTCLGGSADFVDGFVDHPDLHLRARRVSLDEDATPPGHTAI